MNRLPETGLDEESLFEQLAGYRSDDLDTHGGRTWAYVYDHGRAKTEDIAKQAYLQCLNENGLDPTVFPSVLHLETDIVGIVAKHLNGDAETVGNATSGGTESCMLAVKTARDFARAERGIERPSIIVPETVHAAFHKAAHYFDMELTSVKVDPVTFRVTPEAIEAAMDERTALVVVSAPSYAHGVVDPVEAVAKLCLDKGVLLHVDACVGGWVLPYFKRLGADIPAFDFSVEGVTSISVDLHKYAYAPKGASVILYRDKNLRRYQMFACAGWTGYTVINPTILSTKSAGPLAGAWATLHHLGDAGYVDIVERTKRATEQLLEGIAAIDGLSILGQPDMSLFSFVADGFSIWHLADAMKAHGWYIQPQLGYGSSPANIHLTVTATSLERVDELLSDLKECCEWAKTQHMTEDEAALLDSVRTLKPEDFTPDMYEQMLGMAGFNDGAMLPEKMASINALLDALPASLREQLLIAFINDLYRPAAD